MRVPITVVQFSATADKQHNLTLAGELIGEAAASGARIAVLPEASMYLGDKTDTQAKYAAAESLDGPFVTALGAAARRHGIHVVAGMTECAPSDGRPFNTVTALDASGTLLGAYRKIHLYDAFGWHESDTTSPGPITTPVCFDVDGLRFGVMTCYDLRFPEMARTLIDAGTDVIVVPAAWVRGPLKESQWELLLRARAVENTVYVVAAGQSGTRCIGNSMMVDPMGSVIAGCSDGTGIATALLDGEFVRAVRATNPSLDNRRYRVIPNE